MLAHRQDRLMLMLLALSDSFAVISGGRVFLDEDTLLQKRGVPIA